MQKFWWVCCKLTPQIICTHGFLVKVWSLKLPWLFISDTQSSRARFLLSYLKNKIDVYCSEYHSLYGYALKLFTVDADPSSIPRKAGSFHPNPRTDRWCLKKSSECDMNKQLDFQH